MVYFESHGRRGQEALPGDLPEAWGAASACPRGCFPPAGERLRLRDLLLRPWVLSRSHQRGDGGLAEQGRAAESPDAVRLCGASTVPVPAYSRPGLVLSAPCRYEGQSRGLKLASILQKVSLRAGQDGPGQGPVCTGGLSPRVPRDGKNAEPL